MSEDILRAEKFIDAQNWTFAKTMAEMPHEYIVLDKVQVGWRREFQWFIEAIKYFGVSQKYGRSSYKYLEIDGYKYWAMPGYNDSRLIIINRATI